ncbi:S26 family signal peptidase [Streptomyces sp. NPDC000134]|uniref:S26 family signal peptidase n=1 Tax=Streptomyces sp. NPDC000134 TaxID=3364536 RepID=UPI00367BD7C6
MTTERPPAGTRRVAGATRVALLRGTPAVLLGLGGRIVSAFLARGLVAVTVRGASMEPAYHEGDRVLVCRHPTPLPGQVVVVERPGTGPVPGSGWHRPPVPRTARTSTITERQWLIKRVAAVPGDPVPRDRVAALAEVPETRVPAGSLVLLGDNQEVSFDSRQVGYFPTERVLGTVLCPLPRRASRTGDTKPPVPAEARNAERNNIAETFQAAAARKAGGRHGLARTRSRIGARLTHPTNPSRPPTPG